MMHDTGHWAYPLSQAQVWSNFTVPDPIKLEKLDAEGSMYAMTSHDAENSCTLLKIDPKTGFTDRQKIPTENYKVFAICLLNSGIPGVSLKPEDVQGGDDQP